MTLSDAFAQMAKSTSHVGLMSYFNEDTIYAHGAKMIQDRVNNDKTLSPSQRQEAIDRYTTTFISEVQKQPADKINESKNPKTFATNLLNGIGDDIGLYNRMAVFTHPDDPALGPIVYGQVTAHAGLQAIFAGYNNVTKKPIWKVPVTKTPQTIQLPNGKVAEVTRFDDDGRPMGRIINGE
jgi:hypothetical protein